MIYEYPAIIRYEPQDSVYYVDFPDITGCFTDGRTLREALDNAEDALNTMLSYAETQGNMIPTPSEVNSLRLRAGEIVTSINVDTGLYSKIAV